MFSRLTAISLLALTTLAVATPAPVEKRWGSPTTTPAVTTTVTVAGPTTTAIAPGDCNTGPIQCCSSTESASSPAGSRLLGLLGIVVDGLDVVIGLGCSPISVVGVGSGSACNASPVCCENNAVGGLISIGCVPVTL
ncbi:fungal hydrophobin-domain-containing protein [Cytidiella melzeri]|nr:fungal hydrophobin-domain-containing protein [Cytidiella melzeri]